MQLNHAAFQLSLVFLIFFPTAASEQYPQDALRNTRIPLDIDAAQIGLKGVRRAIKEKIDERISAKIAIDKCKTLMSSKDGVEAIDLYNRLSVVAKKCHDIADKKALLELDQHRMRLSNIIDTIEDLGVSAPSYTLPERDVIKINTLISGLESGAFEDMQQHVELYSDVHNRFSKAIEKKKTSTYYTLVESEVLGQDVPESSEWYRSNQKLIQKIKSNTVTENKLSASNRWCEEVIYCAGECPLEVISIIMKKIYRINNPVKQYTIMDHDYEKLYHPENSFAGFFPMIWRSNEIPLIATITENSDVNPATQIWFKDGTCDGIRLSDDYNGIDIFCVVPGVITLLSAEYSSNYLVGLYATEKKLEKRDDENETEFSIRGLYPNEQTSGKVKLAIFKLHRDKRRYERVVKSNGDSIRVKKYNDRPARCIFQTEEFGQKPMQLVGMDKANSQLLYRLDRILYQTPLHTFKPREIETPGQITFKKMISPTRFISFFLTQEGDVWVRLFKSTKGVQKTYGYDWCQFDMQKQDIQSIAAEWWPEAGKIGFALLTKDGKLFCEQGPDTVDACIQWMRSVTPEIFHQLQPYEKSSRLYVYNKKAILLYGREGYRQRFLEVPIAWS